MKRIAQALLVVSLATTGAAAFAATPSFPSSAQETTSLSSEFPNIRTYADSHLGDAASQTAMTFPSGGVEQMPLSREFPNIRSYADLHRNDAVAVASTPTFPSSTNETTSMASEGLVPGLNGGTSAYAGVAQPSGNL
ncbi:MAG: hypothetical protein QOK44_3537 [Betaproteobacteria bacterium]|jgi:hypothetical protein|nr:hypothetical protein [Betaproteobacteria bacterium]